MDNWLSAIRPNFKTVKEGDLMRAFIGLLAVLLSACVANPYARSYIGQSAPRSIASDLRLIHGVNPLDDEMRMMEDGYERIGHSAFNGRFAGEQEAISQAKSVGAEVVIVYSKYSHQDAGVIPLSLPSIQTSTATAEQGGGNAGPLSLSAITSAVGSVATMLPYKLDRYDQAATYWRKPPVHVMGVFVRELTADERRKIRTDNGVAVQAVVNGSPAFDANILRGDTIAKIGDAEIRELPDYRQAIKQHAGSSVNVVIIRDGKTINKQVTLNQEQKPSVQPQVVIATISAPPASPKKPTDSEFKAEQWTQKSYQSALQQDWIEAIRTASAAITLNPNAVNAYLDRSWAYIEKGMLDKASADVDRALEIDPENPLALNNRGVIYRRTGLSDSGKADFEKACRKGFELGCNNFKEMTGYALADTAGYINKLLDSSAESFNQYDWDEVIRITTQILQLDPNNSVAYANRSGAFNYKGMLKEALADGNAATKLNPDLAIAYQNRGFALERMGNKKDASLDYEIACRLKLEMGCSSFEKIKQQLEPL